MKDFYAKCIQKYNKMETSSIKKYTSKKIFKYVFVCEVEQQEKKNQLKNTGNEVIRCGLSSYVLIFLPEEE